MYRILLTLTLLAILELWGYCIDLPELAIAADFQTQQIESLEPSVPLFDNLGDYHHPISTDSDLAQRYFDQGLILTYGFNHAEAARSFREATRLDPNCAMCYWGVALVLGPNINAAMDTDAVPESWQALQNALERSQNASNQEQAYIQALAKRYSLDPRADRPSLDIAYVQAMRDVSQRYPDDLDAGTLFAEALMDTMPWDYWIDGKPKPKTQEILATLDSVLDRNPNHPGANHFYIHTVEASPEPDRAIPCADRLRNLVPGSGHLVHMPSHIYIRVGRYHDAAIANQRAIAVDQNYITQSSTPGFYRSAYVPHNPHFLWASASMEGRSELAMQAARHTAAMVDQHKMRQPEYDTLQHYYLIPLYTLARFGKWDEILAEPSPGQELKYPTGVWHYARGMAFLSKGQLDQATEELNQLNAIAADPELAKMLIWDINPTANLLHIASEVLAGELAAKQADYESAIAHLQMAVRLQDELRYDEPETWYYPVRQSLGAVLLDADQTATAEQVYRQDLEIHPDNGWSLFGLAQSLQAQGKIQEARAVQERFQEAWKYADVILTASRF